MEEIKLEPSAIFKEYKSGVTYKAAIGDKGLYEQTKINERFFVGDHWYGVNAGNDRPLVRRNLIKRIGEYKISVVGAAPIAVNYSAEGVPDTTDLKDEKEHISNVLYSDEQLPDDVNDAEISVIMSALSNYFSITAERVKLNKILEQTLKNSYISGTGLLYTYWDNNVNTGLYADKTKKTAIKGDISCEVLDVENVNFGDPNNDDIQSQPYIIISQRKFISDVKREAELFKGQAENIKPDRADTYNVNSGTRGATEPDDSKRVTVLTKFYKKYDKNGNCKIYAIKVTESAVVRPEWELKSTLFPLAKFCWENRRSCIYGDSEITYLIGNQIAINRALTTTVWAVMNAGMPKLIYNRDIIPEDIAITNEPGQIIGIAAADGNVHNTFMYLQPPSFASQFENLINDMAGATLLDSGANDAALGDLRPDNASAIIQMREAALQPMQLYQNRFYDFIEDLARIWADMWINYYGERYIKSNNKNETRYIRFDADRYKNIVITAKIDVGASSLWSESIVVSSLNNLLSANLISFSQYLERLPNGLIPDKTGLIEEIKQQEQLQNSVAENEHVLQQFSQQYPEEYKNYQQLPLNEQELMLAKNMKGMNV